MSDPTSPEKDHVEIGPFEAGRPMISIIEATRFWVREEAINDAKNEIDISALRPLVELGGIQYGRVRETFELLRPSLAAELEDESQELAKFLQDKK